MSPANPAAPSGDRWLEGPGGEIRWGAYGAAGLFLVEEATNSLLLQKRADWTAHGGTWGIPGGALNHGETPFEAALREAEEETGVPTEGLETLGSFSLDLGWWEYTTLLAVTDYPHPLTLEEESAELAWVPLTEFEKLDLHPAFRTTLPPVLVLFKNAMERRAAK